MLEIDREDAIIVGTSRLSQLEQNMKTIVKNKLPEELIKVFNDVCEVSRVDAPEYFKYNITI